MILCSPALHKTQTNCAHLGEIVNGLKSLVHTLGKQLCEFLIIEYLQRAPRWDLTHRGRMEMVGVVAVTTLHKYRPLAQTLGKNLTPHVEKMHPLTDVATYTLNCRVSIDTGELPEAEPISVHTRVCVAIHDDVGSSGVKYLPHVVVELVVGDGTPVGGLQVINLDISAVRCRSHPGLGGHVWEAASWRGGEGAVSR